MINIASDEEKKLISHTILIKINYIAFMLLFNLKRKKTS